MMKRITFDGLFCDIARCSSTPGGSFCENGTCSQRQVWERLRDIERILGDEYDLDRLRNLLQAEKDGRLVVLPCKVGDTVYYPSVKQNRCTAYGEIKGDDVCCGCDVECDASNEPYIFVGEVAEVEIVRDGIFVKCHYKEKWNNSRHTIGLTVFLTHKEAEAALAQKGGTHEADPV